MNKEIKSQVKSQVKSMIRVDHAGEAGAVRIYEGQRAIVARQNNPRLLSLIDEMHEQEQAHLKHFDALIVEHDVRPTALAPLWHVAGYALGAASALLGPRAAMACTAAVESEIDAHYESQLIALQKTNTAPDLQKTIADFRADEEAHRALALEEGAEEIPAYPIFSALIRGGCRVAIEISKKI